MKFVNKKQIQQHYREQMQYKKEKNMGYKETILMILIVSFLIFVSNFYH